jgi:hypothetical protein
MDDGTDDKIETRGAMPDSSFTANFGFGDFEMQT